MGSEDTGEEGATGLGLGQLHITVTIDGRRVEFISVVRGNSEFYYLKRGGRATRLNERNAREMLRKILLIKLEDLERKKKRYERLLERVSTGVEFEF